ncbi:phospholipase/carboxylesterase [Salinimicrobium marinum]|uniref:Phospholipase/carboxylesterase n=1 Tax=Salinimicrobium marinum TaxID=680283 RepID=A0A918SEQ1_9FLAO|nr:dienelactone hydrolase family protein [Salinimicrobium marinum]GHA36620.1 phospholipase/carboxylesterase [Salinimicrobium marinum]
MEMHQKELVTAGTPIEQAEKALIMIHGRGGTAEDILAVADHFNVDGFALVAPKAYNNSWYPLSFMAPEDQNQPWLSSALELLKHTEAELNKQGIASENIYFFGFSQGACLTLEYITRNAKRYGGAVAIIGGLIGENINTGDYITDFEQTPVFIGTSDPDTHVPLERVQRTAEILKNKNAEVLLEVFENVGHTILQQEITIANNFVFRREKV